MKTCKEIVETVNGLKNLYGNLFKLQEFFRGIGIRPFLVSKNPVCWKNYVTAVDSYICTDGRVEVRGIFFVPEDLDLTCEDIGFDFTCKVLLKKNKESKDEASVGEH